MSRIMIDDFCAPNYIKAIAHQFAYPRRTHTQNLNYINPIFCANPKWSYSQETPVTNNSKYIISIATG